MPIAPVTIARIVSMAATPNAMPAVPISARQRCRRRLVQMREKMCMDAEVADDAEGPGRAYAALAVSSGSTSPLTSAAPAVAR